ncbi:MAG: hypothetical protein AAF657_13845 [Acidobacteriota bacterium]
MQRFDTHLKHWIAAERGGRDADAELALERLFAALPLPEPSAGFAGRVLASAGLRAAPVVYPWWSRATIAACLMVVGLTLAYTLPLALGLSRLVGPSEIAATVVAGFVAVIRQVDELLLILQTFAGVVETLLLVVTAPQVVLVLLALSTLSAFTFRGLSELVASNRNSMYVQAL